MALIRGEFWIPAGGFDAVPRRGVAQGKPAAMWYSCRRQMRGDTAASNAALCRYAILRWAGRARGGNATGGLRG